MNNVDRIRFSNAIVSQARRYNEIASALMLHAKSAVALEVGELTEEKCIEILNSLPCRDVDDVEAEVEVFLQRFFS